MTKNIFLTGGSGFVGKSIIAQMSKEYNIQHPTSSELDLTDLSQLKNFIDKNNFQYIINCAVKGGRRIKKDTEKDFYNNIKIMDNILNFINDDRKLITFSSGAEVYDVLGFYGFSKKICTSLIKNKNNIKNLRIYNVFGELGMKDSFVYIAIQKCLKNEDVVIWEDKIFDIYYINDLVLLINLLMCNDSSIYEEIDCVYEQKYKLSDIAKIIKLLSGSMSNIIIENDNNLLYTGTHTKINNLIITPLEKSLENMIRYISENG